MTTSARTAATRKHTRTRTKALPKTPTGIHGFDKITGGGLPRGRATLVCGGPGCGKTLFATEFLVRGATQMGEAGVFVSFEEAPQDLAANVASLGFDLPALVRARKVLIDHVRLERAEFEETGEFNLDGLFIRLGYAIDSIGAKRVALDTIESLFSGLPNPLIVRAELRRLFRWLKDKGVTTVITAEKGDRAFTRDGIEEYVSDCVLVLDQRVDREAVTRRMHIVKYRGSAHSSNEFPFTIDEDGFSVVPITGSRLDHAAPRERISTGVPGLDEMLGGHGVFRGSGILVSGTAGTGKSTLAASFLDAACARAERAIYFSFEESPATLIRDLRSVGIDLERWVRKGRLRFECTRVSASGLQAHVTRMTRVVREFRPTVAVVDPVSAFDAVTEPREAKNTTTLLADALRAEGITTIMTYLTHDRGSLEGTVSGISSSVDTWILLRDLESNGERDRCIYILKSRGTKNSNQVREFLLTDHGIELVQPYLGPEGVVTGSARAALEARERAAAAEREREVVRRKAELRRLEAERDRAIASLRSEHEARAEAIGRELRAESSAEGERGRMRSAMAARRGGPGRNGETSSKVVR